MRSSTRARRKRPRCRRRASIQVCGSRRPGREGTSRTRSRTPNSIADSGATPSSTGLPPAASPPRDYPARERLGHPPFVVDADREHQLLKTLTLELADLLDQRLGGADQAGGADEAGVDQLGFSRVQIGVVELVRAEMPVLGGRLLHERAVALPDRTQGR